MAGKNNTWSMPGTNSKMPGQSWSGMTRCPLSNQHWRWTTSAQSKAETESGGPVKRGMAKRWQVKKI